MSLKHRLHSTHRLAILALLAALPMGAYAAPMEGPIQVTADSGRFEQDAGSGLYRGNVELIQGKRKRVFSVTTRVTFRELSDRQIRNYIRAVPVLDKAGSYAVQEKGEWVVEALHGSLTNVVGLPLERLQSELSAWFDTANDRT